MSKKLVAIEGVNLSDRLIAIRDEAETVHAEAIRRERALADERIVSLVSHRVQQTIDAMLMVS